MSSRLFQEIREKRGLVYSIASYAVAYRDGGLFVIYAGMSPQAGAEVIRLTLAEAEKMKLYPVDETELRRGEESPKCALNLGAEKSRGPSCRYARQEISHRHPGNPWRLHA